MNSSVDIMNTDLLNISRISVPDTLIDDIDIVMNENPNSSVLIDPDVFNASIISANDSKGESKSEKVKMIKNGRKNKKNCDLKTGKITKAKMNKKDKKDCVNAVYKTNKPIEYCPSCMVKLIPTQFTINTVHTELLCRL